MAHVDIISDVLAAAVRAFPHSEFIQGLSHDYLVKGGLSKRQLEGLFAKAQDIKDFPPGKLATLEAIILKKAKKYRSPLPPATPLYEKDESVQLQVDRILQLHPQHKRVLFFQSRLQNNASLNPAELKELERFYKLLVK